MGTLKNTNNNLFTISPHIMLSIVNNVGEMYIYDDKYQYILNSMTASDLIDYFHYTNNNHLSEEIIDTMMNMKFNTGTN